MAVIAPYRIKITVLAAKVSGTLTGFPVYVNLADLPAAFFSHVISGADIRVTTADGGTEVPYELVAINTGAQTGQLWFKGDISSSANTDFYIYYGSPGYAAYSASAPYGSQAVWGVTAAYIGHFEGGSGNDSSISANNGTVTEAVDASGKISRALSFDGSNDKVVATQVSGLGTAGTVSAWVNTSGLGSSQQIFNNSTNTNDRFCLDLSSTGHLRGTYFNGSAVGTRSSVDAAIAAGTFYLVAYSYDGTGHIYINGVLADSGTTAAGTASVGAMNIGVRTGSSQPFFGLIDEVHVYTEVLSVGRLLTEYNNQSSSSTFYSVSSEESFTGSGFPQLSAAGFVPNLAVGGTIKPKVWLA